MTVIRKAEARDLGALAEIERSCFDKTRFPLQLLRRMAVCSDFLTLVVEGEAGVVGYASAHLAGPEARLISIAVAPAERGKGAAKELLARLEQGCRRTGMGRISLEVAVSNALALRLYLVNGYLIKGMIRDYYGEGEDAFYMEKRL